MPTYLSPGVYVEEMEPGARPIEGVGTAVAAFVGGFAILVLRMDNGGGPRDSGPDDGAIV